MSRVRCCLAPGEIEGVARNLLLRGQEAVRQEEHRRRPHWSATVALNRNEYSTYAQGPAMPTLFSR